MYPFMPIVGATVKLPSYTYNQQAVQGGATNYTFSGISFGTAAVGRLVVVTIKGGVAGGGTVSSVTIGGVGATLIAGASQANGSAFMYAATVPTGTSGTIAFNWSGSQVATMISCYSIYNLISNTVNATASSTTVAANGITTSAVSPPAGSVVIALYSTQQNFTVTWSGTAGLVEDNDFNNGGNYRHSSASKFFPTAATTPTIISTSAGAPGTSMQLVGVWR